jgi:hypothetical protein
MVSAASSVVSEDKSGVDFEAVGGYHKMRKVRNVN